MEKNEGQIFEKNYEIGGHIVLWSAAEFQKETEKKEKKRKEICSTDLQTCVIKKIDVSFALQSLPSLQPYLVLDTEKVERYYCAAGWMTVSSNDDDESCDWILPPLNVSRSSSSPWSWTKAVMDRDGM